MASKLAQLMQSASTFRKARRTNDASLKRSSRSSCTTRHRPDAALAAAGSYRSEFWAGAFMGRLLLRQAKCDAQLRADLDGLTVLHHRCIARPGHGSRRRRLECSGGVRVQHLDVADLAFRRDVE